MDRRMALQWLVTMTLVTTVTVVVVVDGIENERGAIEAKTVRLINR